MIESILKTIINFWHKPFNVLSQFDYISFDIFDTLIVRKCGAATNIFDIVEDKYNESVCDTICGFKEARIDAEAKARAKSKRNEISLDDIYTELYCFSSSVRNKLQSIEIETEIDQCVGNKPIVEIYKTLIQKGKQLFITSDMYLSIDVIERILSKNELSDPNVLYLSSDRNATKRTGSLFKVLLSENDLKPNNIIHIGDNLKSDCLMPRKLGMHSFWL